MIPENLIKFAEPIKVLDAGHVRLVDVMGDDSAVVQAARVSYGKGTKSVREDRGLIRYLMRHQHTSPFEMAVIKLHVRVPMDTWRQWIRHRTASVNEYSTRYSEAIDSMATTDPDQWRLQSQRNKQGSAGVVEKWPEGYESEDMIPGRYLTKREEELHLFTRLVYQERLNFGVAREVARKDLPLSNYTEAYWQINLHNLLHFLGLRMDSHAQWEIRQYANAIGEIVAEWVPLVWEAFNDYHFRRNATLFTASEMNVLTKILDSYANSVGQGISSVLFMLDDDEIRESMNSREWTEFWAKLARGEEII